MEQVNKKFIKLPNWSFKRKDSEKFKKLRKSIKKHGQIKNIVLRKIDSENYEVIDGKLVFQILKELDKDFIWCTIYKDISNLEAKIIYLQLDFNFEHDYINTAKAIKKLCNKVYLIDLAKLTNFSVNELKELLELNKFDFERYKPLDKKEQDNLF